MNSRSIFDKTNLINATSNPSSLAKGQYNIRFRVNTTSQKGERDVIIDGILKEPISWNVNAEWGTLGFENLISSIAGSSPILDAVDTTLETMNALAGSSFTNTGLFTKKFYRQSGYLTISPKFRVFDFDNLGQPLEASLLFASLCIPKVKDKRSYTFSEQTANKVGSKVSSNVRKTFNAIQEIATGQSNGDITNAGNNIADTFETGVSNLAGEKINWSEAPDTMDIEIGQWLTLKNVVLEGVSVDFSEQMTKAGPQFADFTLTLSTIEALMLTDQGTIDQVQMNTIVNKDANVEQITVGNVTGSGRVSFINL